MKITRLNQLNKLPDIPLSLKATAFFDIETTGFSRDYCTIYMIGAMCIDSLSLQAEVELFFAKNPQEESDIIKDFFAWLLENNIKHLISFNGASFDVPFINARIKKLNIDENLCNFSNFSHFDIYKEISPLKEVFQLANCKQKSIEAFLGIDREDEMNGGQLIEVYKRYVSLSSDEDLHLLVIHNYEDVLGMLALLPILNYLNVFKGISDYIDTLNYSLVSADTFAYKALLYSCKLSYSLPVDLTYIHPIYKIKLELSCDRLNLTIPFYEDRLRYYYKNYKDYFYLPHEGIAVPKAIASSVDNDRKIPATFDTCYILADFNEKNAVPYFRHCMEILL